MAMAENIDHCLLFFSGGKDSIVMLNLAQKFMPNKYTAIFMTLLEGLDFQERTIKYYEQKYGIKIERELLFDAYRFKTGNKKIKIKAADSERYFRDKYDCAWIMYGYRRDESLQRRGYLGQYAKTNFIDWQFHKLFPLGDWSKHDIEAYVKQEKLYIPPEYRNGYRDINVFGGEAILYIKNRYPNDYAKIIEAYPIFEAEAFRQENKD
jgi:3'-phosphoadenosine 5'-phosphosulfate sulfotransferase (PAPS reductase)/FAD synthetase